MQNIRRGLVYPGIASVLLHTAPLYAMYKCEVDGKTAFQELPCDVAARQTVIRSRGDTSDAPAAAPSTGAPSTLSDQEKLDALESDRLRREVSFELRDKMAEFSRYQAWCERNYGVVFTRNPESNGSISSAIYPQSTADASKDQAAARCIAQVNELQQKIAALRLQCAQRKCE